MIAFRVNVDGQHFGDFGVEDFAVQNIILGMGRRTQAGVPPSVNDGCYVNIGGLTEVDQHGKSYHYRWVPPKLTLGTKIEIEIVEVTICAPPASRHEADGNARSAEEIFTEDELREMRYEDYLELKQEFEPD